MKVYTVKDLKKALEGLPDEMEVWSTDTEGNNDGAVVEHSELLLSPKADEDTGQRLYNLDEKEEAGLEAKKVFALSTNLEEKYIR